MYSLIISFKRKKKEFFFKKNFTKVSLFFFQIQKEFFKLKVKKKRVHNTSKKMFLLTRYIHLSFTETEAYKSAMAFS